MRIGLVTASDARSRESWSGTHYYMAQALQKHCGELSYLGPIKTIVKSAVGDVAKILQSLSRKRYWHPRSIVVAMRYARILEQRISKQPLDLLVAPLALSEIAFLKTELPMVYVSDATSASLVNYYPYFSHLLRISIWEGNALERRALRRANLVLYPSKWAAEAAISDYHIDKAKVHVVPFGPNIEDFPDEAAVMGKKQADRCRLLFLGKNWERKGGDIAFETLLALEEMGVKSELTVCGVVPPKSFSHERMTVIPFLDKGDEIQRQKLYSLLSTSDFLLLPTRAELYGMVFCEASAFGLPSVTTNTGGIPGAIEEGKNGFMLPLSARGTDYARVISKAYRDGQYYRELVKSSRAAFNEKLNWDAWANSVKRLIDESGVVH
jgi:glycosyltransferase involved in cell wall biosynthesis